MISRAAVLILNVVLLSGCATLLPHSIVETSRDFENFEAARQITERLIPLSTRTSELKLMGFDALGGSNVTTVSYPEIVARLVPYTNVSREDLDEGILRCIQSKLACRGYVFRYERQVQKREGNFLTDFFNIKRRTRITG
jgi:hypothetical protein